MQRETVSILELNPLMKCKDSHFEEIAFSNSLITHQVKTKKVTTMKEVLISTDFDDCTSQFTH